MTEHIQIGDVSPRINYIGDGLTVAFSYSFPIFVDTDIEVYIDGALQTLTTDYAVSDAGNSAGGTVTFTTAPTNGADILFVRRLTIARTSDFEDAGLFRGNRINDDFDFQMAAIQQVADDQSRSISLAHTDAAANLKLPEKSSRASKQLGFDGNGDVSLSSPFTADHSARDMAASALAYAMILNDAASINHSIGAFYLADDFETDSLAVSTNATYDTSGNYYAPTPAAENLIPIMTGYTTPSGTVSASSEFNTPAWFAWGAFNPNDGGVWATVTGAPGGIGWLEYAFPTAQTVTYYELTTGNGETSEDHVFEAHNGSSWVTIDTRTNQAAAINAGGALYQVSSPGSYTRYRYRSTRLETGDAWTTLGSFKMFNADPNLPPSNITLAPSAASLSTANPISIVGYIVLDPQEQITIGTDIVMTFSIDGGTTHATGSWTKVGNLGSAGMELYRVEADVSAQSGSSLTYEITTFNNKHIRVHQVVGLVPTY